MMIANATPPLKTKPLIGRRDGPGDTSWVSSGLPRCVKTWLPTRASTLPAEPVICPYLPADARATSIARNDVDADRSSSTSHGSDLTGCPNDAYASPEDNPTRVR